MHSHVLAGFASRERYARSALSVAVSDRLWIRREEIVLIVDAGSIDR